MSLADELADNSRGPSPTEAWIADWYDGLETADQATFDAWLQDPRHKVSQMHRALQRRGYPCEAEALRRWADKQRDSR